MTQEPEMRGEKIYEMELDLTGVTDFGVSMEAILAGKEKIPLQGGRFDLAIAGRLKGRLAGRARGVDYVRIRADGRMELDLHVTNWRRPIRLCRIQCVAHSFRIAIHELRPCSRWLRRSG